MISAASTAKVEELFPGDKLGGTDGRVCYWCSGGCGACHCAGSGGGMSAEKQLGLLGWRKGGWFR